MKLKITSIITPLLLVASTAFTASTWPSDGTPQNIQDIHNNPATQDGDTITLPPGTFDWTTGVTITKGITLQGESMTFDAGTANATALDATVIQDDLPATGIAITISVTPSQSARITGISFTKGARTVMGFNGMLRLSTQGGKNYTTRVDHCHFFDLYNKHVTVFGESLGVADHNVHDPERQEQSYYVEHAAWNGETFGNGAWADYPYYGSEKFFFVESNTIRGGPNGTGGSMDAHAGGRYVARYNFFENSSATDHGTESGPKRSVRAKQVYGNMFHWTLPAGGQQQRGGGSIWHDNAWTALAPSNGVHTPLAIYQEGQRAGTWGWATGDRLWDANDTDGQGNFVEGQPSYLHDNGTTTSGTTIQGALATFTDSTKDWAPNRWQGFMVKNLVTGYAGLIQSNTANKITWAYNGAFGGEVFDLNTPYEIRRIVRALDQNGSGKGDLVQTVGGIPQSPRWLHQALEPCMSWNNVVTSNGQAIGYGGWFHDTVFEGRDYYNLGGGFLTFTIPAQVQAIYTPEVNGVPYTQEYQYPHPLTETTETLPVFRAAGTKSVGTTGAVTVTAPAGVASGDLEILVSGTDVAQTLSITGNGGSAWTPVNGTPVAAVAGTKLYVWYRIRQAGDSDPQVMPSGNFSISTRLAYQTGTFDTTTPVGTEARGTEGGADTSFSFTPGTSTSVNNCLVLVISTSGADQNAGQVPVCTNANLTNLNSRANDNTNSGGGGGYGLTEGALATAGNVGTFACTYALGSGKAYLSFAIRP